jgi:AcrR family transcriptional regulator
MTEARSRRGKYSVGIARRAKIIEVALQHFARSGYSRSSLKGVATEVGISEAGLLHHFASKEELLQEVLSYNEELDRQDFEASQLPEDGLAYLDMLTWCVERNVNRPGVIQLFSLLSAEAIAEDHPAHTWFVNRYEQLVETMTRRLEIGVSRGEIRPEVDCREIARELTAVSDGLQIQWLLAGRSFDLLGAYRAYAARVRAIIATVASD